MSPHLEVSAECAITWVCCVVTHTIDQCTVYVLCALDFLYSIVHTEYPLSTLAMAYIELKYLPPLLLYNHIPYNNYYNLYLFWSYLIGIS